MTYFAFLCIFIILPLISIFFIALKKKDTGIMKPTLCFYCNKSFKKPVGGQTKCPECSSLCYQVHPNFSPPPKNDQKAWELCEFLVKKGFDFSGWVKKKDLKIQSSIALATRKIFVMHKSSLKIGNPPRS